MGERDGDLSRGEMFYMDPQEDTFKRTTGGISPYYAGPVWILMSICCSVSAVLSD